LSNAISFLSFEFGMSLNRPGAVQSGTYRVIYTARLKDWGIRPANPS
jgi:hypothetical protein